MQEPLTRSTKPSRPTSVDGEDADGEPPDRETMARVPVCGRRWVCDQVLRPGTKTSDAPHSKGPSRQDHKVRGCRALRRKMVPEGDRATPKRARQTHRSRSPCRCGRHHLPGVRYAMDER